MRAEKAVQRFSKAGYYAKTAGAQGVASTHPKVRSIASKVGKKSQERL